MGAIITKDLNTREYQRAIQNGQSRDTEIIGNPRYRTLTKEITNRNTHTTQKAKKMKNTGVNPNARERSAVL